MRHDEDITFSASQCQGTAWNSAAEMCSVLLGLSLSYLSWFDGSGVPDLLPPGINMRGFASCLFCPLHRGRDSCGRGNDSSGGADSGT